MKPESWSGNDEELVINQIVHNCNYWCSHICKRETLEKYCREKGVQNPSVVIDDMIRTGVVFTPKTGYVGLTEPEKHGVKCAKKTLHLEQFK